MDKNVPPPNDLSFISELSNTQNSPNASLPFSNNCFSRYTIVKQIGSGGMGKVYQAFDNQLHRTIAIKVMIGMASKQQTERFLQEAKAMAQLRHPNIICLYEIGEFEKQSYFSMELIEGGSLRDLIKKKKRLPGKQSGEILYKIVQAIAYAHQQKIIHRDLKPENILLREDGEPVVMDFGIAKFLSSEKRLTKTGAMMGTLSYMSPEQANGLAREIDERSDIYALGAILYEMLSGKPAFAGTQTELMVKIFEELPPRLSQSKLRVSPALEAICFKALAKDKKDRYPSATEMAKDIERYLHGDPVLAQSPNFFMYAHSWFKRNSKLLATNIVILLMMGVFFTIYFRQAVETVEIEGKKPTHSKPAVNKTEPITEPEKQNIPLPNFMQNNFSSKQEISNSNNSPKQDPSKQPLKQDPPKQQPFIQANNLSKHEPPKHPSPRTHRDPGKNMSPNPEIPFLLPSRMGGICYMEAYLANPPHFSPNCNNVIPYNVIPQTEYTIFITSGDSAVQINFFLPELAPKMTLELEHLTSLDDSDPKNKKQGYSPITILVNDQIIVRDFNPKDMNFVRHFFPVEKFLRAGINYVEIRSDPEGSTRYWIRSVRLIP